MYIRFESIELQNFGSVGNVDLSISPGIFHVDGVNLDNNSSRSNGSGKSTIFSESFRWVIFGSTAKKLSSDGVVNDKREFNCFGKLKASITDDSGYEFPVEIRRYRKHKEFGNRLEFDVDGREETKQTMALTQAEIERVFRLPIKVFSSVYLMEQGMDSKFTSLSNVESKNYIESLRNVTIWDNAYFRASGRLKKWNTDIQEKESIYNQNRAVVSSKTKEIFSVDESIASLREQHDEDSIKQQYETIKVQYEENLEIIQKAKEYIDWFRSQLEAEKSPLADKKLEVSELYFNIKSINSAIQDFKRSIDNLSCPTCGRDFENRETAESHALQQIAAKELELKEVQDKHSFLLKSYNEAKEVIDGKIQEMNGLSSRLEVRQEKAKVESQALDSLSKKSSEFTTRLEMFESQKKRLKESCEEIEKSNESLVKGLDALKEEVPYYKELTNIFSFKGIRSYLITTDIEFLNRHMREFSTVLFSDMIIQLYPQVNKEGMVTTLDTLAIFSSGVERIYSKLSGGEKRRADICVQLAIREFVRKVYNVSTNLFSLDEIFEGLDEDGVHNVMELVTEVSDVQTTIYIISHRSLSQFSGGKITVQKENGITSIV